MHDADVVRLGEPPGSAARLLATEASMQRRRELIAFISRWLDEGGLGGAQAAQARDARLVLVENIVQLAAEVGRCDDAEAAFASIAQFGISPDAERQAAYAEGRRAVAECREAERLQFEAVTFRGASRPAGFALVGAGSASVLVGLTWNLALLDEGRELDRQRDRCEDPQRTSAGACDRAQELRTAVRGAKAPVAVFAAAGLVTAGLGIVLVATAEDRAATVVTSASLNRISATVSW